MADEYRNEISIKGKKSTIDEFIKQYFTIVDGLYYFDFEKVIPSNGKPYDEVWACGSEAYNFEIVEYDDNENLVFRFDTIDGGPGWIVAKILNEFRSVHIVSTLVCEMLSYAIVVNRPSFRDKPFVQKAIKSNCTQAEAEWINSVGQKFWGYSVEPDLVQRGFVDVGDGHFMRMHFGFDSLQDLYPQFKKA